ncbi:MAG: dihydrofolate reductase [Clostridioides sp.]|jgi:dihydrofolate reductase|nr:dihydrofolate reductase [Clostridioides sp.]
MKAIVNVDKKWAIGNRGQLLVTIPEDMRFFKETTIGNVVVMGRKTFESLPKKKPLAERLNLVLTNNEEYLNSSDPNFKDLDEEKFNFTGSKEVLLKNIKQLEEFNLDVYIIGGESVYKYLLEYCSEAIVTKNSSDKEADTFFPNLDEDDNWKLVDESEKKICNINDEEVEFYFTTYENLDTKKY